MLRPASVDRPLWYPSVLVVLLLFLLGDFSDFFTIPSLFPRLPCPLSFYVSQYNFSGSLVSWHPCTFYITLSPYFIHFPVIFCKMLCAIYIYIYIYIAPNHFSYFLLCPSPSLFHLCMFHCILGLVALTVSEWSVLSPLFAVTFLSLRITRCPANPDVPIPGYYYYYYYYYYCCCDASSYSCCQHINKCNETN